MVQIFEVGTQLCSIDLTLNRTKKLGTQKQT